MNPPLNGFRKYEDVECPRCGAAIGELCRALNHGGLYHVLNVHAARRRVSEMR